VERLTHMVCVFLAEEQGEWDLYLGCLVGAYRSTPQRWKGVTPKLLVIGREARLPPVLQFPTAHQESEVSIVHLMSDVRQRMLRAHKVAHRQL